MTVLGGEFAVLMSVEGIQSGLDAFDKDLNALCQGDDIAYIFRITRERDRSVVTRPYRATIVALDHPGIVHAIAGFFSARQINIRDLNTETQPAAHTGTPIFSVSLVAEIPATVRIHNLKSEFEEFCAEADLDGSIEAER
jgi:glycine cleavage system transcriptional repressor